MKLKPSPKLNVAMGQIDVVPKRPDINAPRIVAESIAAAKRGVRIIAFPEMSVSGYLIGDLFNNDSFARDIDRWNKWIAEQLKDYDIVVIFGSIGIEEGKVNENGKLRKYNAAFVVQRGKFISTDFGMPFVVKALLPNYRIFDDSRYFHSLRLLALELGVTMEQLQTPVSVWIDGVRYKLGVMLCEDMWDIDYYHKPAEMLAENGAQVLFNLSWSNWSWRKNAKRHEVVKALIAKVGLPFIYVNGVGCQNNGKNFIPFDGSSTVYNERGQIVFLGDMYEAKVYDVLLGTERPEVALPKRPDVAEMFWALVAATKGFLSTSALRHQKKIVIGLSGGIDSMVSAAFFVWLLGRDRVILVNMPYKDFNSDVTKGIAAEGARNLGVDLWVRPIDDLVDADAALGGIAEGTPQHKTIQAAMRHQVLKTIAAEVGGIVINNGNKTELAFGFATLIGDMRGYFAPLADMLKGEVYQMAHYLNTVVYEREVIPQACIDIPPMDELTKEGAGERKDPFDYGRVLADGSYEVGYHDAMVRSIVELQEGPEWFLEQYRAGTLEAEMMLPKGKLRELFPHASDFVADLEQKLQMFAAGIHKRTQSVPAAHFSRSAFGWDYREFHHVVVYDGEELEPYYSLAYQDLAPAFANDNEPPYVAKAA